MGATEGPHTNTRSAVTRLSTYYLPGSAWVLWTKGAKPKQMPTLVGPPGISFEVCLMRRCNSLEVLWLLRAGSKGCYAIPIKLLKII